MLRHYRSRTLLSAALFVALMCIASTAYAQESPSLRGGHVTIAAGLLASGSYDVGSSTAQLRGNAPGTSAPPFTLFTADARVTRATAPEFRVGVAMSRRLAIDGGISFGQPRISVDVSDDQESASLTLDGEKLQQYQIDAALTWQPPIRMGRRVAPFVVIGGGYLRQLHEDRALAETGQVYYGGAGARYWLYGAAGGSRALGIRGDARWTWRRDGIDFDNQTRSYPSVSLMLFAGL